MASLSQRVSHWIALFMSFFSVPAWAAQKSPYLCQATAADQSPIIDGVLNDACWRGKPSITGFRTTTKPGGPHPEQTKLWVRYDKQHLYIGARCYVSNVAKYQQKLKENPHGLKSGIRLLIDWRNARQNNLYEEYILKLNGTTGYLFHPGTGRPRKVRPIDELKVDTQIVASMGFYSTLRTDYIKSRVSFADDSYFIEAAIPFAMMHLDLNTAKTWAFSVDRMHDPELTDKSRPSKARSFWSASSWDPKRVGRLALNTDLSHFHWELRFIPPQPGDQAIQLQLQNKTGQPFAGKLKLKVTRRSPQSHSHRPTGKSFDYEQALKLKKNGNSNIAFKHACGEDETEARYQITLIDSAGRAVIVGSTSRRDQTPRDRWSAPAPTQSEQRAGFVKYRRPYTVAMTYRSVPKRAEVVNDLSLFGCRGEFVPITFAVYALEDLHDLKVSVSNLTGPRGNVIKSTAVDVRYVTHHLLWQEKWIAYSFKAQENLLRRFDRLTLAKSRSRRFWLTVKVPPGQSSGHYSGRVAIETRKGKTHLPIHLTVLPFGLAGVKDLAYFMYANGSLSKDPDTARKVARDMRDHGMTTATVSYFAEIGHRTGKLRLVVDEPAGYTPKTGWIVDKSRPMTYAKLIDVLVKAGFAQQVPLIEMYAGGMGSGYKPELVAELDKIYKQRHWPDVLYYVWDEFDASAEKTRRAHKRFSTLYRRGVRNLKYTTAMTARPEMRKRTDSLASRYHVWILGTPSADLLIKGRAMGKQIWSYGWDYSHSYSTADLRHYFGRYLWKTGLKGASMWCYNHQAFRGRFWCVTSPAQTAFSPQQHKLMFSYVWQEKGEIIPTARWEAIREGIDDYRYLRTLKRFAEAALTSSNEKLRNAGKAGLQLLDKIRQDAAPVITAAKVADKHKPSLTNIGDERHRVAVAVVKIQQAAGLVDNKFRIPR